LELNVKIEANSAVQEIAAGHVLLGCVFTGRTRELETGSVVLVTARNAGDQLFQSTVEKINNVARIGDCFSPGTIAAAVHAGRKFAEEFGSPPLDFLDLPYRREVIGLS
jgi:dimethylamine/trimethylamine dehydrogenase